MSAKGSPVPFSSFTGTLREAAIPVDATRAPPSSFTGVAVTACRGLSSHWELCLSSSDRSSESGSLTEPLAASLRESLLLPLLLFLDPLLLLVLLANSSQVAGVSVNTPTTPPSLFTEADVTGWGSKGRVATTADGLAQLPSTLLRMAAAAWGLSPARELSPPSSQENSESQTLPMSPSEPLPSKQLPLTRSTLMHPPLLLPTDRSSKAAGDSVDNPKTPPSLFAEATATS
mmetsp:Transcript_6883/g.10842  ORF Transcript_6883/g.10842 Transcript_6883/m.10842 type:complete len:231 (-) Transcript_6883:75-767(-)